MNLHSLVIANKSMQVVVVVIATTMAVVSGDIKRVNKHGSRGDGDNNGNGVFAIDTIDSGGDGHNSGGVLSVISNESI